MTVPVPDQLEYISDADGVTKDYPYPTRFLQKDEIVVVLRDADGIDTPQYLNRDFSIAGSAWPNGGLVSFYNAPPQGMKVVRSRQTQAKQTVDLGNKQRNDAEAVELQLDRTIMALQDQGNRIESVHTGMLSTLEKGAAAQAAAEVARDIAVNAASDAVSQGNVPIYSTLTSISALEIPIGINAIRVNGRIVVGDGDGGLYISDDNGSSDTGISGDGRIWYKVKDVEASRVIYTPRINQLIPSALQNIAEGLPLSPQMFGAVGQSASIDTPALIDLFKFTAEYDNNASRLVTIDGGGWRYHLNKEIKPISLAAHYGKKTFQNIHLLATSSFDGEYMVDLSEIATDARYKLGDIIFDKCGMQGAQSSSVMASVVGWIKLAGTHGIKITNNVFSRNNGAGILDTTPDAATEIYINNNRMLGGTVERASNPEGIRLHGYDSKIYNNVINGMQVGIRCERGGNVIIGNHIYNEDILSREGIASSIQMRDAGDYCRNFIIENNYIDSMPLRIYRPSLGHIVGNKFLLPNRALWGSKHASFIEIANATGIPYDVNDMIITHNIFFCNGGEASAIGYIGQGNNFNNSNLMKDNTFRNVPHVGTVVSHNVEVTGKSSVIINTSGKGIGTTNHSTAVSCAAQGNAQVTNITRDGENFTVNFSALFTGRVVLTTTTNNNGVWF